MKKLFGCRLDGIVFRYCLALVIAQPDLGPAFGTGGGLGVKAAVGGVFVLRSAFIAQLESFAPDLSLDWFRRGTGEFEVVMTYADRDEFDRSAQKLTTAGYRVD